MLGHDSIPSGHLTSLSESIILSGSPPHPQEQADRSAQRLGPSRHAPADLPQLYEGFPRPVVVARDRDVQRPVATEGLPEGGPAEGGGRPSQTRGTVEREGPSW